MVSMCRGLGVQRSGFYAWLHQPSSARAREHQCLLGLVKQAWMESGMMYGYRKITADLRDLGERCGKHRLARLMRSETYGRRWAMGGVRATALAGRPPRRRTCWIGSSMWPRRTRIGSLISPISAPTRVGGTWPR